MARDTTGFDSGALAAAVGLTRAIQIDASVRDEFELWTDMAPLYQPRALAAIDVVTTAFHRTIPAASATYAVPARWRSAWLIQRFGFHGLSHADASVAAARLIDRDPRELRTVVCHLGAGASLCAVEQGRSIDTTMGFTPLGGLDRAAASDEDAALGLDESKNSAVEEGDISSSGSAAFTVVVGAREDRQMAREARAVLT